MAYSAICDRLHFHFDIGNPTAKIFPLLSGIGRPDIADQNESVIDRCMAELNKIYPMSIEEQKCA